LGGGEQTWSEVNVVRGEMMKAIRKGTDDGVVVAHNRGVPER